MTAKELKHKGRVERGGTNKELRSTNRSFKLQALLRSSGSDGPKRSVPKGISRGVKKMLKIQASRAALADFEKKLRDIEEERFGRLPDREISNIPFEEKPFPGEVATYREIKFSVVSIALFDGDCVGENMLFACSGIALPHKTAGTLRVTRFVTSSYLVTIFNERRNRDDKLAVQVRLPDGTITDGILGLYDHNIAIVTSLDHLDVCPVDLNVDCPDGLPGDALAVGRTFESGRSMFMPVSLSGLIDVSERLSSQDKVFVSYSQGYTEAALGGPVIGDDDGTFQGMITDIRECRGRNTDAAACIIEPKFLCSRLELFLALNPKKLRSLDYSLPEDGVSSIIPSGIHENFLPIKIFWLSNAATTCTRMVSFGAPHQVVEHVWDQLEGGVVVNISRRVVALASFNGDVRYFACTGLLIKWRGSRATHTVVLTSASLVRSRLNEDHIDENLRAGIGGPLIDFDGRFVGMNFYDEGSATPFLPRSKVVHALRSAYNLILPSERGCNPWAINVVGRGRKANRWPVPKPYWFHGALDVDMHGILRHRTGRTLL